MAIYPDAVWRPLPENKTQPRIKAVQAIWHSAVDAHGPTSLYPYFARDDVRLESHFFVKFDGTVEQYIDTARSADANYKANQFFRGGESCGAVSVETEDDGDPDNIPWSPEQMEASVRLGLWLHKTHGIPVRLCPGPFEDGFGYHTLFPEHWTPYRGKTCPGRVRIEQFHEDLLPSIQGAEAPTQEGDEDDMASPARTELDNIELVVTLYRDFLGRTPTRKEVATWLAEIRKSGAEAVVAHFPTTPEAQEKKSGAFGS